MSVCSLKRLLLLLTVAGVHFLVLSHVVRDVTCDPISEQCSGVTECPKCPMHGSVSIDRDMASLYWQQNYRELIGCICALEEQSRQLKKKRKKIPPWAAAFIVEIASETYNVPTFLNDLVLPLAPNSATRLRMSTWEILGPLPVGKLEVDGDPTFSMLLNRNNTDHDFDVISHVLSLKYSGGDTDIIYSEHVSSGRVTWQQVVSRAQGQQGNGMVEVTFPSVDWSGLVQSLSTLEVQEFQGWARSTSTISAEGMYTVHCPGVHSVYVRQKNTTQWMVGDVYHSGWMRGVILLQRGVVGVVLPLRGVGGVSFACSFELVPRSTPEQLHSQPAAVLVPATHRRTFDVQQVLFVPDLLRMDNYPRGLLLTSVFCALVTNVHESAIDLSARIVKVTPPLPKGTSLRVEILFSAVDVSIPREKKFTIQSGLTVALPLEIIPESKNESATKNEGHNFLLCDTVVLVYLEASEGSPREFSVKLSCRHHTQSLLISYLDHDGSVAQGAVVLPQSSSRARVSHPVLLTLHGTGISPSNQADAYKYKPPGQSNEEYIFGVKGYWLVAPSRHGAHNWEGVGGKTARHVLKVLQELTWKFESLLPGVTIGNGIIAGHSMGGHGAWMTAVTAPDLFACLAPTAGWIRKEEYHVSNSFLKLDSSNTFIDLTLKMILEMSMSEYHVDRLVKNLNTMKSHIRVGGADSTTHPWFSRRMQRLLAHHGHDSVLEEVDGKDHWWWDTLRENDGGVLNDLAMRQFYAQCLESHDMYQDSKGKCSAFTESRPLQLVVVNVESQEGLCGVRITQQYRSMQLTRSQTFCEGDQFFTKTCRFSSDGNVKRVGFQLLPSNASSHSPLPLLYGAIALVVDGVHIPIVEPGQQYMLVCWKDRDRPYDCSEGVASVNTPAPVITGPVRMVYSKPFCVVYGTHTENPRVARYLFQSAVYLANANVAAHMTFVPLYSDVEYMKHHHQKPLNVIFIGGSLLNKAMALQTEGRGATETPKQTEQDIVEEASPVHFSKDGGFIVDNQYSFNTGIDTTVNSTRGYSSIVYTFPMLSGSLGVCIHAASPSHYLLISRLMWPTVPPMVRAPFANYFPDFIVFEAASLWSEGFGAVILAGFWDYDWHVSTSNSFYAEVESDNREMLLKESMTMLHKHSELRTYFLACCSRYWAHAHHIKKKRTNYTEWLTSTPLVEARLTTKPLNATSRPPGSKNLKQ